MSTINDLGKIVTGKTPLTSHSDYFGLDIPFITPRDMKGSRTIVQTERYLSHKGAQSVRNCIIPANSVCVSCIGSDMGKVVLTTTESVTNQQINSIIVDEFNDPRYVYYMMCSLSRKIKNLGENATAIPILNKTKFSNIDVSIPLIETQKRIADILSAYDDLIENNQRQIKLLEEAAMLLYKEWFIKLRFPNYENTKIVDGVPEGWKRASFNDLCELVKDGCKVKDINKEIPYIGLEHIPRRSMCLNEWGNGLEVSSNKYCYQRNDVLFGKIRPYFHKVGFAINEGVCSTDAMVFRAKDNMFGLLLTTAFSDDFVKYSYTTCREGSKMPRADWNEMSIYPVMIPNYDLLTVYNDNISRITNAISIISRQNHELTNARDKLLPKLMSGEIEV